MSSYRGRPFSPVESQVDLMRSHSIRPAARDPKSDGERTLQLAVPQGWTVQAKCIGDPRFDESVGLAAGQATQLCAGCPVIEQCLSAALEEEHGLSAGNRYTVRGGLSPKERALVEWGDQECARGHKGRWANHKGSNKPRCVACIQEDNRRRIAANPEHYARQAQQMQESLAIRRVSCLDCKAEMRVAHFERHVARNHSREKAA